MSDAQCVVCGSKENIQFCTGCAKVYYCGGEHQTQHWPTHKKDCLRLNKQPTQTPIPSPVPSIHKVSTNTATKVVNPGVGGLKQVVLPQNSNSSTNSSNNINVNTPPPSKKPSGSSLNLAKKPVSPSNQPQQQDKSPPTSKIKIQPKSVASDSFLQQQSVITKHKSVDLTSNKQQQNKEDSFINSQGNSNIKVLQSQIQQQEQICNNNLTTSGSGIKALQQQIQQQQSITTTTDPTPTPTSGGIKALQQQIQQQQLQQQQSITATDPTPTPASGGIKALQQQIQQQQSQPQQPIISIDPTPSSGGIKALQQQISQQQITSQQPPQTKPLDSNSAGGIKVIQQQIQLPKQASSTQQQPTQQQPIPTNTNENSQIRALQQQIQTSMMKHKSTPSMESLLPFYPQGSDDTNSSNSSTPVSTNGSDTIITSSSESSSIHSSPIVSIEDLPPPPTPIAQTQKPGAVKDLKSKLNINFQMPGQPPIIKKPPQQTTQENSASLPTTPSFNNGGIPPQPFSSNLSSSDPVTYPNTSTTNPTTGSNRQSTSFTVATLNNNNNIQAGGNQPTIGNRERSIHHKKNQSLPDFSFDYSEYSQQQDMIAESEENSDDDDSLLFKERRRPKGLRSKDQSSIEWESGTIEFKQANPKPTSDFGLGSSRRSPPEHKEDDLTSSTKESSSKEPSSKESKESTKEKDQKEPSEKKQVLVNKLKDLKKKAGIVRTLTKNVAKKLNSNEYNEKQDSKDSNNKQPVQSIVDNNSNTVIFGLPLEVSVERSARLHPLIPDIVYKCIEYIRENSMKEEGIFRISGSSASIMALKAEFDSGSDVDLNLQNDQHVVSGILKLFLRQIPETLFTASFGEDLENLREGGNSIDSVNLRIQGCIHILKQLPEPNRCILHHLCSLLNNISFEPLTKMTTVNLAIVFAPSLGCSVEVMSVLIDYYDTIFSQQTYSIYTSNNDEVDTSNNIS